VIVRGLYIGLFVVLAVGDDMLYLCSIQSEVNNILVDIQSKKGETINTLFRYGDIFELKALPIGRSQDFDALLSFALDRDVEWLIVRLSGSQGSKRSSTQPAI
jgi:hypothetical protein